MPILGAHMSIAGGLAQALVRGHKIGCQAIQIFTKSTNRWEADEISEEEVELFFKKQVETNIPLVFAHDAYLINLGSPSLSLLSRSWQAFILELERAACLKLPYLVIHPGAHLGLGEEAGIKTVAESLNLVFQKTETSSVMVLLETTAGQGTSLGYRFEHIRDIIARVENRARIGFCLDSCHIFVAGYDLSARSAYEKTIQKMEEIIGLEKLKLLHLNDSKKPLASRVDRHEHIGRGYLGLKCFKFFLNDPRFQQIPMIIETPKSKDLASSLAEDRENLEVLRSLYANK